MDFPFNRRTGATYGRVAKKPLVHDLFDYRVREDNTSTAASKPSTISVLDTESPPPDQSTNGVPTTRNRIQSRSDHALRSPLSSGISHGDKTSASEGDNGMTFDIASSDDDGPTTTSPSKNNKRRKIASLQRTTIKNTTARKEPAEHTSRSSVANLIGLQTLASDAPLHSSRQIPHKAEKPTSVSIPARKPAHRTKIVKQKQAASSSKPAPRLRISAQAQRLQDENTRRATSINKHQSPDISGHLTDTSTQSHSSAPGTPGRKRLLSRESDMSVPSPTSLGITSLKLHAESHQTQPSSSPRTTSEDETDEMPRKKNRSRLIDRLDAPRTSPTSENESSSPDEQRIRNQTTQRNRADSENKLKRPEVTSKSKHVQAESSQTRQTYASRARTTYAKERSHLSDMMDSLENLTAPSSQQSVHELLLPSSSGNLGSQLQLEGDDSDESSGPGRLKSIHELRQAGAHNRFDRELQAVLEDIEAKGPSNKSLRLHALIKLFSRLTDKSFLSHITNIGHASRLAACTSSVTDGPGILLLILCLYRLGHADTPAPVLSQLLSAVLRCVTELLPVDVKFADWLSERKQNLSKSTICDLIDFESDVFGQHLLDGYEGDVLYPNAVALHCVNHLLRGLLRLGNSAPTISPPTKAAILDLLHRHSVKMCSDSASTENRVVSRSALKLLEAFSIALDDFDKGVPDPMYRGLGRSLDNIMHYTGTDHAAVHQDVLRTVVSLSNSKARVCRLLAQTPVVDSIFSVIRNRFLTIATQAETENEISQTELDSVILALGSLLNFAECDDDARRKLSTSSLQGTSYLESLAMIFNSQVARYEEAMTEDQTQVMVAFGYLSMLLCTMALDVTARQQITQLLQDRSFDDLCGVAETFFRHLRTLDQLSNEDDSMSLFTQRFSAILNTLRASVR